MKTLLFAFFLLFSLQGVFAQVNPQGTWQTDYRELYLYYDKENTSILKGEYFYKDPIGENHGYLFGNMDGIIFNYHWKEYDAKGVLTKQGIGVFRFNEKGSSFSGDWKQDRINNSGKWNGTKASTEIQIDPVDPPDEF